MPICKTCLYWDNQYGNGEMNECHRHAPNRASVDSFKGGLRTPKDVAYLFEAAEQDRAVWLLTASDDFCGDHPDFPAWLAQEQGVLGTPE